MTRIKSDRTAHDKRYVRNYRRSISTAIAFALIAALSFNYVTAEEIKIHRCIGSNGEPTFSDRPCSTMDLSPKTPFAAQPSPTADVPALIVTQTCPTSPEDLRSRIVATFAAQSSVGLSGLFLWDGHARGSSTRALTEIANLVREPLTGVDLDDNATDQAESAPRNTASDASIRSITVRTARELDRVPREAATRFELRSRHGCWWLIFTE